MRFTVKREEYKNILEKDNDGKCTYSINDNEYECLIVGISTNGTYILETIEEKNDKRNI